jgi:hypothetical protein
MKKKPSGDYVVGFCRPPRDKRFRKGTSGNPAGRPKGRRNVDSLLREIHSHFMNAFHGMITINTPRGQREVSGSQAFALTTFHAALKDAKAAKLLLDILQMAAEAPPEPVRFTEVRRTIVDPKNTTEDESDGDPGNKKKSDDD